MPSPFVDLLADLAGALDEVGAGWYLFGAQAALIHGAARLTADVDVTIHLRGVNTKANVRLELLTANRDARRSNQGITTTFVESSQSVPSP